MKKRTWFENPARTQRGNDRIVILHCLRELLFIRYISLENAKPFMPQGDRLRRANKRGDVMTSRKSLLNNLLPCSPSRSDNK
ncbi:MAG: hypothetical protein AUG81_10620 [Verrucomicrobia bacterium 13_1_20CM_4_54_11]|nr:MAG: hypothetical protein AUG81_10620 [Verrucomicrobia bacterium 13_1_20CM_4_54_11]